MMQIQWNNLVMLLQAGGIFKQPNMIILYGDHGCIELIMS